MEIERINENTIKFYISYLDIEDRGFEREEIWYNRERSEQLFWQMMEEVNFKEDFTVEGPLWIQVQAMEKGLEITVTKAQLSNNGENIELPLEDDNTIDIPVDEKIESILSGDANEKDDKQEKTEEEEEMDAWMIFKFNDFEDVIQLSHYFEMNQVNEESTPFNQLMETLYYHKGKYFLYLELTEEEINKANRENIISQVSEFADKSKVTKHILEEYGKIIIREDVFKEIRSYFPA